MSDSGSMQDRIERLEQHAIGVGIDMRRLEALVASQQAALDALIVSTLVEEPEDTPEARGIGTTWSHMPQPTWDEREEEVEKPAPEGQGQGQPTAGCTTSYDTDPGLRDGSEDTVKPDDAAKATTTPTKAVEETSTPQDTD